MPAAELGNAGCVAGNIIVDGGFETTDPNTLDNPNWTEASTNFGTPLCTVAACGSVASAFPRTGTFWAWFGGVSAAEVASLSQAVTFPPAGATVTLNFYLWIGFVSSPFTDTLVVQVDGVTQTTFTEPTSAEVGYTVRSLDLSAFADGASHTVKFLYNHPAGGGIANFSVDDVTLDVICNPSAAPVANEIDAPLTGAPTNNNRVFDPNETVLMRPTWMNTSGFAAAFFGALSNFTGPGDGAGVGYSIVDAAAVYGSIPDGGSGQCSNCYFLNITETTRPVQHWDATVDETLTTLGLTDGAGIAATWTLHIGGSFADVDPVLATNPFYPFIETIFHYGVTSGCAGGTSFCPLQNNLRQEMAVFLLKDLLGSGYVPPDCTGVFQDVPCPATPEFPYSNFVEDLSTRGITTGCQVGPPALFCPGDGVTRAQMAVFLLKAKLGGAYAPPNCTGLFQDVPCPATPEFPYSNFIEDLFTRGITSGCQIGPPALFCPDNPVTRQEMAVFLSLTFDLALYGPPIPI